MPKTIEVVYENGVFKPLDKVYLKEGERVKIQIEEGRKERRLRFIMNWKPIRPGEKITAKKIEKIRQERYENIH